MPFKKGDKNINRSGRPRNPDELSDAAGHILRTSLRLIKDKIKDLSPTQHIKLIGMLMPYTLPRLQGIEFKETDTFEHLTDSQIEEIINRILDGYRKENK